jgi:hypothetical protein
MAGKKIICQRAAGYADLVPYLHVADESAGFVQLARSIATWFHYVDNVDVRCLSDSVLDHLEKGSGAELMTSVSFLSHSCFGRGTPSLFSH